MMKLGESFRKNERFSTLVSYLIVSLMMASFAVTVVQFGRWLVPSWEGGYLPWVILIVSLDAMYTKKATRNLTIFSPEWLIYRGCELVVLFLGLKLLLYLLRGPVQLINDLGLWQKDFIAYFFNGEYLIASALMFVAWAFSGLFAEDLAEMEGDFALLEKDIAISVKGERIQVRQRMVDRIFFFGAAMIILVTLMRVNLNVIWGERTPLHASVFNVVLYFMLALALLSQTQFAILRASWSWGRVPLSHDLGKRWTVYSLFFLLALAVLVMILPTRYTLGFLSFLGYALDLVIFFFLIAWGLLLSLFTWLITLLGIGGFGSLDLMMPSEALRPQLLFDKPKEFPWLEVLKSLVFWLAFIGLVGFSVYQYFIQHQDLLTRFRQVRGLSWLVKLWDSIISWLMGMNKTLSSVVEARLRRVGLAGRRVTTQRTWRYINLRTLTPRQRVLFFYLVMVQRGGERGIPRREEQTPYEYENQLCSALPQVREDLESLTDAFVEARYSRHPVTSDQAWLVKRWWDRIRRAMLKVKG